MKPSEWLEVCALVANLWPSQPWNPSTATAAAPMFEGISAKRALDGVLLLAEDGREFAPPPGVVLVAARRVAESVLALADEDQTRDLTPEELTKAKENAARLREETKKLSQTLSMSRPGRIRLALPPKTELAS